MNDFLDSFITRKELAERWRVSVKTLLNLEAKAILPASVDLPGKRAGQYRLADIHRLEDEYKAGTPLKQRVTDVIADGRRAEAVWKRFGETVSAIDEFADAFRVAVECKLTTDPKFIDDDLDGFLAERRAEYVGLLASLEKAKALPGLAAAVGKDTTASAGKPLAALTVMAGKGKKHD